MVTIPSAWNRTVSDGMSSAQVVQMSLAMPEASKIIVLNFDPTLEESLMGFKRSVTRYVFSDTDAMTVLKVGRGDTGSCYILPETVDSLVDFNTTSDMLAARNDQPTVVTDALTEVNIDATSPPLTEPEYIALSRDLQRFCFGMPVYNATLRQVSTFADPLPQGQFVFSALTLDSIINVLGTNAISQLKFAEMQRRILGQV